MFSSVLNHVIYYMWKCRLKKKKKLCLFSYSLKCILFLSPMSTTDIRIVSMVQN